MTMTVVAAPDAEPREEVGGLIRPLLHIAEGEGVPLALGVAPHHRAAIGFGERDVVDDVVAEVEVVGAAHVERRKTPRLVVGFLDVAQIDVSHEACSFFERSRAQPEAAARMTTRLRL